MPPTSGSKEKKKTIKTQKGRIQKEIKIIRTSGECNKESNERKQRIRGIKGESRESNRKPKGFEEI